MFGAAFLRSVRQAVFPLPFRSSCDDDNEMGLVEQADMAIEARKLKIKTPVQFDSLKHVLGQGHVASYDGFRIASQKQVNLNTVISHFYWMGSQAIPQPIYQYRIILHDSSGSTMLNVGSDMDFNLDGEFKAPLLDNVGLKTNFTISEQAGKNCSIEVSMVDGCSSGSIYAGTGPSTTLGMQYMQAITPALTLGGQGEYEPTNGLSTSFGGIYDTNDHQFSALWGQQLQLCYLRRVNPNRVHLSAELKVEPNSGASEMSVSGEYTLKQSKVNFGIDSGFTIKSLVETTVTPGVNIQLASDVNHLKDSYKFGLGFVFNN